MAARRVRALLMGGQACVFYGAAEFSRDTDLLILADARNLQRLQIALEDLQAERIAVPPFSIEFLQQALLAEEQVERESDRLYWQPLKAELEQLRHAARKRK